MGLTIHVTPSDLEHWIVLFQLLVQRKQYFTNWWHILCLVIIGIGLIDIIQNFVLPSVVGENNHDVFITATVFILLRTIRVFRLLEVTLFIWTIYKLFTHAKFAKFL